MKKTLKAIFCVVLCSVMLFSLIACGSTEKVIICSSCGYENVSTTKFCSNCGKSLINGTEGNDNKDNSSENEVVHTHSFGDWITVKAPTCTQNGMKERVCSCGYAEKSSLATISCNEENGRCTMCNSVINPMKALIHYIITNGSQLSSGYEYLYTDRTNTDSMGITTYIEYNANDTEFTIGVLIQLSNDMSVYTTNVVDMGFSTQKIQMQFREGGRTHYCSANISTTFSDSNNEMTSYVYRGEAPASLQEDIKGMLKDSTLIMLSAVNTTLKSLNLGLALSDFGYIHYR